MKLAINRSEILSALLESDVPLNFYRMEQALEQLFEKAEAGVIGKYAVDSLAGYYFQPSAWPLGLNLDLFELYCFFGLLPWSLQLDHF